MSFKKSLSAKRKQVEAALRACMPPERTKPVTIHKAMRYSLLAGGKRMRPILCLAAAEACGGTPENALPLACAVECVHTYSLIHDDLPCMDDDDLRRGMPTSHKVFGEGIAVLAGDALVTRAFEIVASAPANRKFSAKDYVRELAEASGSLNLIAGQVADLEAEGSERKISLAQLQNIHERKTGALIRASLRLGGMSAGASPAMLEALQHFGASLGLAFQIIDDILDVTQSSALLGKSAGKDVAAGKATYPSLMGLVGAQRESTRLTKEAHEALTIFGGAGEFLSQIADHLLDRDH
jgi:geranylgeranyl diphosphate synthase type II